MPSFQARSEGPAAGDSTPQIDPYSPDAHAEGAESLINNPDSAYERNWISSEMHRGAEQSGSPRASEWQPGRSASQTPIYRPPYGVADPYHNTPNSYPGSQNAAYTQSLPVPYRPINLPTGHSIICATCSFPRPSKQESCPNCGRALVNNSGQNGLAPVEIAEGWNWGAFMFPVLWSVAHENWFGLLALVPFLGVIMSFVLGAQGNQLAWQHRRFQSVEHFQEVQRVWRNWSIGAMAVVAALIVMALFGMPG